ncbi:hypothetical protein DRJ54_07875 [Candidatus Acetothermia bacterium]|nr:MAG: hypothetical protein DRJ54_07875 [Candidatus Acetothermia bacterium]
MSGKPALGFLLIGTLFLLSGCLGEGLVSAGRKRVTFALVLDTRAYNGKTAYADILDTPGGTLIETVSAVFASYPNTANHSWARFTTLGEIETNHRYFLDFFIDMDGDGVEDSGDLRGIQHFDVMPNATWSETKYFSQDLEPVP